MLQKNNAELSRVLQVAGHGCMLVYFHLLNYASEDGTVVLDAKKREDAAILVGVNYTEFSRRLGKLCSAKVLEKIKWNTYKIV